MWIIPVILRKKWMMICNILWIQLFDLKVTLKAEDDSSCIDAVYGTTNPNILDSGEVIAILQYQFADNGAINKIPALLRNSIWYCCFSNN